MNRKSKSLPKVGKAEDLNIVDWTVSGMGDRIRGIINIMSVENSVHIPRCKTFQNAQARIFFINKLYFVYDLVTGIAKRKYIKVN